jgi:hypothetical protein
MEEELFFVCKQEDRESGGREEGGRRWKITQLST